MILQPSPRRAALRDAPRTTTIVLHGRLAKKYGARHVIGAKSAAEAAHALCALHPGFREDFVDRHFRVVRGSRATGERLTEQQLTLRIGEAGELHFMPVAAGRKSGGGGTGKAILGAVIIVAAIALAGPTGGTSLMGIPAVIGVQVGVSVALMGVGLLLQGITAAISPQPKNNANQTDPRSSFGLSGPTNSAVQGSPIPVVYGRTRVGSVVASMGYSAEDYNPNAVAPTADSGASIGILGTGGRRATLARRRDARGRFLAGPPPGTGAKGKGGGQGGATEAPNTLQSNAVVRIIDILSEGPIGGLVDGAKSIFFNNTPLMASDGSYNFQGVTWEVRLGYPDQDPVPGYPAAEETLQIGVQVKQQVPIIRTITSGTATAATVTMRLPGLVTQNSTNGNLEAGPPVQYKYEIRPAGTSGWLPVVDVIIKGQKCTSPYQRTHRFDLPHAGQGVTSWDIRMTRVTADSATTNVQSDTYWDSVTMVTDHQLTYGNTAYIALTIDAAAFGAGQIPTRQYEIDGILCQVPANYDAVGHQYATSGPGTYAGVWDGASWAVATTSNPAWCLYDMLSNARYGVGLPAEALAYTRYDLFTISQYCDGRVPSGFTDGQGNMTAELRYALNVAMTTQEDAYRVIQSMVGTFRGMSYWGAGRVQVTADMPGTIAAILGQANVGDGDFNIEGTPLRTRHTVARVAWLDPQNSYRPAVEVVEDFDAVVTYGQIPVDLSAFGCTSRGLAHRLGKWLLDTEHTQTDTISTKLGLEELGVRPGDIVKVADKYYSGIRMSGRCMAGSTTTRIKLDAPVPSTGELSYYLSVLLPDGTIVDHQVVTGIGLDGPFNGPNSVVTLAAGLPAAPADGAMWLLSAEGTPGPHGPDGLYAVQPRQYRVITIAEPQRGILSLGAVFHDPNKYARVEYGLKFDPTPYSTLGELLVAPLPAPTNVSAIDGLVGVGTTNTVRATCSFTKVVDPRVVGTEVRAAGPQVVVQSVNGSSADFDNLQVGSYVFSARSVGRDGRTSVWVDSPAILVDGKADPPSPTTGFTATGGAMMVALTWTASVARDILHYEIWRAPAPQNGQHPFPTASYIPTGTPAANGATMLAAVGATSYVDLGDVLGPDKGWAYWIRPVNTTQAAGGFQGPVWAVTKDYITDNLAATIANTAKYAQTLLGQAPTVVANLGGTGGYDGQLVLNSTDGKLYRWTAGTGWTAFIPLVPNSAGQLTASQIAAINAAQIIGQFTPAQATSVLAALGTASITDDKIASLAGQKVTGQLINATMPAGRLYDVDPATGATVTGVSTAKLLGKLASTQIDSVPISLLRDVSQLTGQQLQGLISAARIADQIVASQLAAGSVTTEKLSVGSPNNLLQNSTFPINTAGWQINQAVATPIVGSGYEAQFGLLDCDGGLVIRTAAAMSAGGIQSVLWYAPGGSSGGARDYDAFISVTPGQAYEAQALYANLAGSVSIALVFVDGNSKVISSATVNSPFGSFVASASMRTVSTWKRLVARATAPAGAAWATLVVNLKAGVNGEIPTAALSQMLFGLTVPAAVLTPALVPALPWQPGGLTTITGDIIRTGSIYGRSVAANTLTGDKMIANSISTRELAVGNSANMVTNSCCAITAEGWSTYATSATGTVSSCASVQTAYATSDGAGVVQFSATAAGANVDTNYLQVACVPGETWEAQAMLLPFGAAGSVLLEFVNKAGAIVPGGVFQSSSVPAQPAPAAAAQGTLAPFVLAGVTGTAPAGAVAVYIVLRAAPSGANTGFMPFTRTLLGKTVPGATQLSPWAAGGVVTIGGGILASSAVVTRHVATGAITAEKAAFASPGNVIGNPCCPQTATGWDPYASPGVIASTGSVTGDSMAPASYALAGQGTGALTCNALGVGQQMLTFWDPDKVGGVPCNPGDWWEAQALLGANRCYGQVQLVFADVNGTFLAIFGGARIATQSGGTEVSTYGLSWCKGQAPAGAQRVRLYITGNNDGAADLSTFSPPAAGVLPYVFFTRCVLGPTSPVTIAQGATPQPFQIGGVTQIVAGLIKNQAVVTRTLAAGAVSAEKLSVGSETNVITNSCGNPTAAGWSAGVGSFAPNHPFGLVGYGSAYSHLSSLAFGAVADFFWQPLGTYLPDGVNPAPYNAAIPVNPGELWEVQAKVITHRCSANLFLLFIGQQPDGSWAIISSVSTGDQAFPILPDGRNLGRYNQMSVRGVAPAGASLCTLMLRQAHGNVADAVFPGTAGQDPYMIWTQAGLGKALPNVPITPWGPGGVTTLQGGQLQSASVTTLQLGVGSVMAVNIGSKAVQTDNLAAGAVTAEKAAFGSANNVIWNACCDQGVAGWGRFVAGASMPPVDSAGFTMAAASLSDPTWALPTFGSAFTFLNQGGKLYSGQFIGWEWAPYGDYVPAATGKWYGAGALLMSSTDCPAFLQLLFWDGNKNLVGAIQSASIANAWYPNGKVEGTYKQVQAIAQAPANTVYMSMRIYLQGTPAGTLAPAMLFTKAQLGQLPDGATVLGTWSPGGITTMDGSGIKTNTVTAVQINTASLLAATAFIQALTATTVTTASVKSVLINTNKLTAAQIDVDNLVVGGVKAGAIGADQIAAGQLKTVHLAADFALASSAQIGVLTVDSANIKSLAVNGEKILPGAVTAASASTANPKATPARGSWSGILGITVNRDAYTKFVVIHLKSINDLNVGSVPVTPDFGGGGESN